jgi:hypothetical protein
LLLAESHLTRRLFAGMLAEIQVGHDKFDAENNFPQWNSTFATTRRACFQLAG